eukprot:gene18189-21668_t
MVESIRRVATICAITLLASEGLAFGPNTSRQTSTTHFDTLDINSDGCVTRGEYDVYRRVHEPPCVHPHRTPPCQAKTPILAVDERCVTEANVTFREQRFLLQLSAWGEASAGPHSPAADDADTTMNLTEDAAPLDLAALVQMLARALTQEGAAPLHPPAGWTGETRKEGEPLDGGASASRRWLLNSSELPAHSWPPPPVPTLQSQGNATMAIITHPNPSNASAQLAEALLTATVSIVILRVNISLTTEPLPSVDRALSVLGDCGEGRPLCEVNGRDVQPLFSVAAGGALCLEGLALRHGWHGGVNGGGGALWLAAGSTALLRDCLVEANEAVLNGGAVLIGEGSNLTLMRCHVARNHAGGNGGAIHLEAGGRLQLLDSTQLVANVAERAGGGLYAATAVVQINSGSLRRNEAASGGGLYAEAGCRVAIETGSVVEGNSGLQDGGGIALMNQSHLVLSSFSTLEANAAGGDGGGVAVAGRSVLEVLDARVEHNQAGCNGGGAYLEESSAVISSSWITDNVASQLGGGLHNNGGWITLEEAAVRNNSA